MKTAFGVKNINYFLARVIIVYMTHEDNNWSIPKNTNRKSHIYPAYMHILCVYIFQRPKNTFHKLRFSIFVFCVPVCSGHVTISTAFLFSITSEWEIKGRGADRRTRKRFCVNVICDLCRLVDVASCRPRFV